MFVDFCIQNEEFSRNMITFGVKMPNHSNEDMRKVSYVASEILTCDQDCIADLFIIDRTKQRIRIFSDDDDDLCRDIVKNGDGDLTIVDPPTSAEDSDFTKKYVYLLDMLGYLDDKFLDENCINYICKVLTTLIRVKPEDMF